MTGANYQVDGGISVKWWRNHGICTVRGARATTWKIAPGIHRIVSVFGANRMVYVTCSSARTPPSWWILAAHNPAQEDPALHAPHRVGPGAPHHLISHSDIDHQGGNVDEGAAPEALLACHVLDRPWVEDTEALIAGRYAQLKRITASATGKRAGAGIRKGCLSRPLDLLLSGGGTFG